MYAMYILRQTTRKGTLALSEIYARQLETKYIIYSYQRSKNRISNPQFSKDRKIRGPNLTHVIGLIADSTSAFNVPFADADERCIILVADTELRHRASTSLSPSPPPHPPDKRNFYPHRHQNFLTNILLNNKRENTVRWSRTAYSGSRGTKRYRWSICLESVRGYSWIACLKS